MPGSNVALSAAREYIRNTSSNITSAEANQQKKKDKGKSIAFDPKKPKRLTIFVATTFPAWQDKYIDLVREAFDGTTLDEKTLNPKISKMGEMKKAMPFVQGLKKRLQAGESSHTVFERRLAFDESQTLHEMSAGLKKTTGCKEIDLVTIGDGAGRKHDGTLLEQLPPVAESAVPGNPAFLFENLDG